MIKESVVWIEQTREQAITLAHDVGNGAEVHALHIRKGTFGLAEKPVGYLVYIPPKWVGLTDEEIREIVGPYGDTPIKGYTRKLFDQIEAKLKEKNCE